MDNQSQHNMQHNYRLHVQVYYKLRVLTVPNGKRLATRMQHASQAHSPGLSNRAVKGSVVCCDWEIPTGYQRGVIVPTK